jgi:hypothetical protein
VARSGPNARAEPHGHTLRKRAFSRTGSRKVWLISATGIIVLAAHCARVLDWTIPPKERTAEGRPGTRRTHGPARLQNKKQAAVPTGSAEKPGLPCAMVLTVSFALSPGTGLSCPCRERGVLLTWSQRRETRTTRLLRPHRHQSSCASAPDAAASIASHPTRRDDREAPLVPRQDGTNESFFSEKRKRNIFRRGTGQ